MTVEALEIRWDYGTELVPLSNVTGPPQRIMTTELWGKEAGNWVVSYVARVEAFSRSAGKKNLRLRYLRTDQEDSRVIDKKNGVSWGVSELVWDASGLIASAKWMDERGKRWSGSAYKVTAVSSQKSPITALRKSVSVIVKTRPDQGKLRDALLMRDKRCILTSEEQRGALEAAHIVPVKAGGREVVNNAILLRADLHCLFDQGLFWFTLSDGEAVVKHSKHLSDAYTKLLAGKKLSPETFKRVKEALRERARLPMT